MIMRQPEEKPPKVFELQSQENNYYCLQRPGHYNVVSNYYCANYCNQYKKAGWTEEIGANSFLNQPQSFWRM